MIPRMENPPENRLENDPECGVNGARPAPEGFGLDEPKTPLLRNAPPAPVASWMRHAFLRAAISLGLNAQQIRLLSLSSPQPFNHLSAVYAAIESQNLVRLYKSARVQRRRRGFHNDNIVRTYMKLAGQAMEYGLEVEDVMRDESPYPGMQFRPDLGLKLGGRQFYVEVQISRIEHVRWHAKLKHYLKLYRSTKRPFRALILLPDDNAVTRVREFARTLLREHSSGERKLALYLFMSLGAFERERDVVKGKVWRWAYDDRERFALL
jgi:hypothetical protein